MMAPYEPVVCGLEARWYVRGAFCRTEEELDTMARDTIRAAFLMDLPRQEAIRLAVAAMSGYAGAWGPEKPVVEPVCICWPVPEPWDYYGAIEPGGALDWNPACPVHPA